MELPLFPLNTVLFPGCNLDLQIFEPRYLDMISRCLRAGHGFGVVRIEEGSEVGEAARAFAPVGCEAEILDWQQRPNGLLGIRVQGRRRFRVTDSRVRADQSIQGEVDWLPERPSLPVDDRHADLLALLEALNRHPMVSALGMDEAVADAVVLGDRLAYLLPLSTADKLDLLALDDPQARLTHLHERVERLRDEAD